MLNGQSVEDIPVLFFKVFLIYLGLRNEKKKEIKQIGRTSHGTSTNINFFVKLRKTFFRKFNLGIVLMKPVVLSD